MDTLVQYCNENYHSKFEKVITHSGNNTGIITNIKLTLSDMSYSYKLDNKNYYWQEDSILAIKGK